MQPTSKGVNYGGLSVKWSLLAILGYIDLDVQITRYRHAPIDGKVVNMTNNRGLACRLANP